MLKSMFLISLCHATCYSNTHSGSKISYSLVMLKPGYFHNRLPVGRNWFLPVIKKLLSTD